jgi:hypothetical protein
MFYYWIRLFKALLGESDQRGYLNVDTRIFSIIPEFGWYGVARSG